MLSLLEHCHGENWKSPTRSFERSGKAKRTFEERKKNVFVKANEQCRACSDIVMARIGNRQHGALGEVERQNALLRNEKRTLFVCIRCTYGFPNPFLFVYISPARQLA